MFGMAALRARSGHSRRGAGAIEPLQTLVAEVEAMTRTPEPFEPRHGIVQEKLPVFGPDAESQSSL
jgi:hypothetical protein